MSGFSFLIISLIFLKFLIFTKYWVIFLFKLSELNITESFSGLNPTPITFAPIVKSQWLSQAPLNPVDPVTRIFKFL